MSFTSSTRSTARMSPPASPMAEVRRPSIPGRFLIAARRVRLYEALGVRAIGPQAGRMSERATTGGSSGYCVRSAATVALVLVLDRHAELRASKTTRSISRVPT